MTLTEVDETNFESEVLQSAAWSESGSWLNCGLFWNRKALQTRVFVNGE